MKPVSEHIMHLATGDGQGENAATVSSHEIMATKHMYMVQWRPQSCPIASSPLLLGSVCVYSSGANQFAKALASALGDSARCTTMPPESSLLAQTNHILYAPESDGDVHASETHALQLLELLQAVECVEEAERPVVWVVTSAAQGPLGVREMNAGLWGMARSVRGELGQRLRCRCIDVNPELGVKSAASLVHAQMLAYSDCMEDEIAFVEQSKISVPRLTSAAQSLPMVACMPSLNSQSSFIVTGGTGGLGLVMAQWLVQHSAQHVVLVSRSGQVGVSGQRHWQWLQECSANLVLEQRDVGDSSAVQELMEVVHETVAPVGGIIHTAAVFANAMLKNQTAADLKSVWSPKVCGAWNLHQQSESMGLPLDLFVLFSSISALFSTAGTAAYSAANASLDAMARMRQASNLPAVSMQWGVWCESGGWKEHGENSLITMEALGFLGYDNAEGLCALEAALHSFHAPVVAVAKMAWFTYLDRLDYIPSLLTEYRQSGDHCTDKLLIGSKAISDMVINSSQISAKILELLSSDLGVSVGMHEPLQELMDSLASLQLRNDLQRLVGRSVQLPSTLTFDYHTVDEITTFLIQQLQLSEAKLPVPIQSKVVSNHRCLQVMLCGVACGLPSDNNSCPNEFWKALLEAQCFIGKPPKRWQIVCDENQVLPGHAIRIGAFIEEVQLFDADWFALSKADASQLDPHIRLMLETSAEALLDANMSPQQHQAMGVFTAAIDGHFGFPTIGCNIPRHIAQILMLGGPAANHQFECASAHYAISQAESALSQGSCAAALVAGAMLRLQLVAGPIGLTETVLSRQGTCTPLDKNADGTICGEKTQPPV